MAFTADQMQIIQIGIRTSALLSIILGIAVVTTYIRTERLKTQMNTLICFMTLADLLTASALFLGDWPISAVPIYALCQVQGFFIQSFFLSSFFWSASMATHCLLAVKLQVPLPSLSKYIKFYHMVAWGIPLIFAFIPIILENVKGNSSLYADSKLWCWIPNGQLGNLLRMAIFYGPLWTIFCYNIIVYIYIGVKVLESRRNVNKIGSTAYKNQKPIQKFAMKTGVYMLAFFFNWGFGTINRLQNILDPDNPRFILFLLHGITVPLGGCLNAIIFFYFARDTSSSPSSSEDRLPINSTSDFSSKQSFKSQTMSSSASSVRPIVEKSKNGTMKSYKSTSSFGRSANSPSPTIGSPIMPQYSHMPGGPFTQQNNSSPLPLSSAIIFPNAPSNSSSMPNSQMVRPSVKNTNSGENGLLRTDNYSTGW